MELKGAIAVVTGASRGIGKAVFDALHDEGAVVIGCATAENGSVARADVSSAEEISDFLEEIIMKHGRIDILVNNAGIVHKKVPLEQLSMEEYERCMAVNANSVFFGLHAVLPAMKRQNSGIIINVASRAASKSHPGLSAYCAAKFAVLGLTQCVAKELADENSNVLCMSVSPSGVDTDMRAELFGAEEASTQQSAGAVADHIVDILSGNTAVPSGADVRISKGQIVEISEMQ